MLSLLKKLLRLLVRPLLCYEPHRISLREGPSGKLYATKETPRDTSSDRHDHST